MMRSRKELDSEVDEEIRFHIEMRTEANIKAGMDPKAARRDAERRFGDQLSVKQAAHENLGANLPGNNDRRVGILESLGQDIRLGVRTLLRSRLATAAAVLSLALGIGANTANFSVVYGVLFRELPFQDGGRLLFVDAWNPDRGDGDRPLTWVDYSAIEGMSSFESIGAFDDRDFTVTAGDNPERVSGASVTPGLFETLGVEAALGRTFQPGEGAAYGFEQVAVISDALWNRMYGGREDAIGETIHLNGREIVVVGVMPENFRFPELEDLWLPMGTSDRSNHRARTLTVVAKLADGIGINAAQSELASWTAQAEREFPETHADWTVRGQWFRHGFIDEQGRQSIYLLFAAVGFVLLLACANVANLLLARSADTRRDLVVRAALGASRARLARQVLTESVLLGLAGGVLGSVIAVVWVSIMERMIPEELAYWITISVDAPILAYTVLISIGTGLAFGLLPAVQASRTELTGIETAGRSVLGGSKGRLRSALVSAEVALSVMLLASAYLMMQSFLELQRADPGFEEERLLSLRIIQSGDHYDDPAARAQYYQQVADRLGALGGVERAVATGSIPADDGSAPIAIVPEGMNENDGFYASAVPSMGGFFETLGIEPLEGRTLTEAEAVDPESNAVMIGESLAQRMFPDGGAVGREIPIAEMGTWRVVGVVPDLQYEEFGEEGPSNLLQVHLPYIVAGWRSMAVLVRTPGDPALVTEEVRRELARIDPTLAPYDLMTMSERRAFTTWPQRVFGNSFAAFGIIAMVLALCGDLRRHRLHRRPAHA